MQRKLTRAEEWALWGQVGSLRYTRPDAALEHALKVAVVPRVVEHADGTRTDSFFFDSSSGNWSIVRVLTLAEIETGAAYAERATEANEHDDR